MPPVHSGEGDIPNPQDVTPDVASPDAGSLTDDTAAAPSGGQEEATPPASEPTGVSMEDVVAQALSGAADPAPQADDQETDPEAAQDPEAGAADPADKDASAKDGKETSTTEPAENAGEGNDDDLAEDPTDEEMKAFRPSVQKRVKKLLSQRNEARREVETLKADLEPDAQAFRSIRTFMDQNSLADQDVQQLFAFGSHLRAGRLDEALKIAGPYMQVILEGSGMAVPQDLAAKVHNGEITEDMARQMGRQRFQAQHATDQQSRQTQRQEQTRAAEEAQGTREKVRSAANEWADRQRQSDPDFEAKTEAMAQFARALVAERGAPKNEQQAVEFAQEAYRQANALFDRVRPKPRPTRQQPPSGASAPRAAGSAQAGSLADAIQQGLTLGVTAQS